MSRGYKHLVKIPALIVFFFLVVIPILTILKVRSSEDFEIRMRLFNWKNCIQEQLGEKMTDSKFWIQIGYISATCQQILELDSYKLEEFEDKRESIKYHLMPIQNSIDSIILTLGIGHNVAAEEKLKSKLTENSTFIGVDPDTTNYEIYHKIGAFLPVSVGVETAILEVNEPIEGIENNTSAESTFVVSLETLTKEYILHNPSKIIDNIWVDLDYSEYSIFHFFHFNSPIFESGYSLCQFNIKVHHALNDGQKQNFFDFMTIMIEDEQFAFLNLTSHKGSWRLFFVNFKDPKCVERYLHRIEE